MKITDDLYAFIWRNGQANNCNTYLLRGSKTVLIDPGHAHLFPHVRLGLMDLKLSPEQIEVILITHGHPDHMEAVTLFKDPTLVAMSQTEFDFVKPWLSLFGNPSGADLEPHFFLREGELTIGDLRLLVISTPGHSPGAVCFYWPEREALFTGDLIFYRGLGRTDLPGGSGEELKESIRRIASLEAEYLLSGHGEVIKGKKAVAANFQRVQEEWFAFI